MWEIQVQKVVVLVAKICAWADSQHNWNADALQGTPSLVLWCLYDHDLPFNVSFLWIWLLWESETCCAGRKGIHRLMWNNGCIDDFPSGLQDTTYFLALGFHEIDAYNSLSS